MFTEQLPDLLDYVNNLPGFVCLVGDMIIHFDNPLQSLTKQTLTTLSLFNHVQVINKSTHRCGHIIDWVIVRPDDDIHTKCTVSDSLESDHESGHLTTSISGERREPEFLRQRLSLATVHGNAQSVTQAGHPSS